MTHSPGQTPLDADEAEGLKLSHIQTREDLDQAEFRNIDSFLHEHSHKYGEHYDEQILRRVHRQMFGDVWRWAGEYRTSNKNIGVDRWQISTELRQALDDLNYWGENGVYPLAEQAIRFHHRLVWIHPFPNGNGRWSRMVADLYLRAHVGSELSWGRHIIGDADKQRKAYMSALRKADNHDFSDLIHFCS